MTFVLALDLATVTGWAKGFVGGPPACGSVRFGQPMSSENAVFNGALRWAYEFFAETPKPDIVVIERMLPPGAMKGATNRQTRDRLAGLHGIVRAMAYERRIYRIETIGVCDARKHFIGDNPKRAEAKREVMQQCRKLGWSPADDNAADALAVWHYQCSLIDPKLALQTSPLFTPGVAL